MLSQCVCVFPRRRPLDTPPPPRLPSRGQTPWEIIFVRRSTPQVDSSRVRGFISVPVIRDGFYSCPPRPGSGTALPPRTRTVVERPAFEDVPGTGRDPLRTGPSERGSSRGVSHGRESRDRTPWTGVGKEGTYVKNGGDTGADVLIPERTQPTGGPGLTGPDRLRLRLSRPFLGLR